MFINYKHKTYALKLAVDRFKCASAFTLIINKHFNFCCFRALAYTTLDRLSAVFLYNYCLHNDHA